MNCIYVLLNGPLPVSHCAPDHPTSQAHVSGEEQVPPFRQGLLQVAVGGESILDQTWYKISTVIIKLIHSCMSIENTANLYTVPIKDS